MNEFVGVKHLIGVPDTAWIKQEALMFDRVAVPDYHVIAPMLRKGSCPKVYDYYDDLDWLVDQGIIFEPENIAPSEALLNNPEFQHCVKALLEHNAEFSKLPSLIENTTEGSEDAISSALNSFLLTNYYHVRYVAFLLREMKQMDACPVFTFPCGCSPISGTANTNEVVEITIRALPMPDYSTSWEQILEYRSDSNSRIKFSRLRHWMTKLARAQNKPEEVEEELETLLDDYSQHMKTYKLKTRLDTLKTIIIAETGLFTGGWLTGIGALPGLVGMVVSPLYSIKQSQVEITREELKAPGREVAYIVESNESFPYHGTSKENVVCELCNGDNLIPEL
jgi:hypothetical protein